MTRAPALLPEGIRLTADREEMVAVPGGRVYVRVNGSLASPRPPLVLVHGGPGSSHWYFLPATTLADRRAIILYDQLDSGRSERPGDTANWALPRFVAELESIRTHLEIDRWHVLGQSWGGTVALEYGAAHQDRLASLIIQSPFVSTANWLADMERLKAAAGDELRMLLDRCDEPAALSPAERDAAIAAFAARHIALREPAPVIADYRAALPCRFNEDVYRHLWGEAEFSATGTLNGYDGTPLLARLNGARTLFVAGEQDESTPETVAGFARLAGARFAEIADAAHMVMNDNPRDYLALLTAWLEEQDR